MNKTEFAARVAKRANATNVEAQRMVQAVLDEIGAALKKGEEVSLTGFGKFSVQKRAARNGVNPRTGEKIKIAASKTPRFTAGSQLKAAVSGRAAKPAAAKPASTAAKRTASRKKK